MCISFGKGEKGCVYVHVCACVVCLRVMHICVWGGVRVFPVFAPIVLCVPNTTIDDLTDLLNSSEQRWHCYQMYECCVILIHYSISPHAHTNWRLQYMMKSMSQVQPGRMMTFLKACFTCQ